MGHTVHHDPTYSKQTHKGHASQAGDQTRVSTGPKPAIKSTKVAPPKNADQKGQSAQRFLAQKGVTY